MTDAIDTAISTNAAGPKRAQGDSGSVEQHSLADQIAAAKYLKSLDEAARTTGWSIRRQKMVPPGAV